MDSCDDEEQRKLVDLCEAERCRPFGLDGVLVRVGKSEIFRFGVEAVRGGSGGGEVWEIEGCAFDRRGLWAACGLARRRRERSDDGIVGLSEDEIAGVQVDGGCSEQGFAGGELGFAAKSAVKRAATQDECVKFCELAMREERIFSQAGVLWCSDAVVVMRRQIQGFFAALR